MFLSTVNIALNIVTGVIKSSSTATGIAGTGRLVWLHSTQVLQVDKS